MHAIQRVRAAVVVAGLVGAVGAGAGVAGAGTAAAKGGPASAPKAKQSIESVVPGFEKAIASGDCQELARYTLHSTRRTNPTGPGTAVDPDTPATEEECLRLENVRYVLSGFQAKKSKRFGSGAVIEGTGSRGGKGTVVETFWTIDVDGKWREIFGGWGWEPQLGQKPNPDLDFGQTANDFLDAFRAKDCKAIWKALNATSASAYVTGRSGVDEWCQDLVAPFERKEGRVYDLTRSKAAPKRLGGTQDVVFYGLPFPNGRYITLIVGSQNLGGSEQLSAAALAEHTDPGVVDYVTNRLPSAK